MPLVTEESDLKGGVAIRRNMAGSGTSVPSSTATSNPQGLVNRGFNLREDSDFKGGSGIRRNMAGKGVISSIATNTPTIPTTGGRGFIIPEVGFGSGTPAVTNIQAQLNRSSRLIDIGGNPIGQLPVSPINQPLPPAFVVRNIGSNEEVTISRFANTEVATPLIETVSRITIPAEASRLESLHVDDGFLDSYYAQLTSNSGLGIRVTTPTQTQVLGFSKTIKPTLRTVNSIGRNINQAFARLGVKTKFNTDTNLDFNVAPDRKEPFVIRGIGQRWGIDRVQKPDSALNGVAGLVQVDKAAYKGKDVVKSYFNLIDDVGRGMVGRTPSVFLDRYFADVKRINSATNSLDFLTRGSTFVNNQDKLQKRNRFDMVTTTLYDVSADHTIDFTVDSFLPDKYKGKVNQFSKGTKLHLNPRAYNPLSVFSVPGVLGINRMSYVDLGTLVSKGTLIDFISSEVLELAAEKATTYITKKVVPKLLGKLPWLAETKKTVEDYAKSAEEYVEGLEELGEKAKETAKIFNDVITKGPIGKANASKIMKSLPGFGEGDSRGQDKVNLIPYGLDSDGKKELYELDWIPFKFKDVRNNKSIVFRAILSGITDTFSPEYSPERYVGRPDSVYVYQGTNREISFTFDVYPKSQEELPILWEKLNYLAGLTYPHWAAGNADGGGGMISPFSELTIGQMYTDSPGYISALTYTVQDNGTWETTFAKLPKYVQVSCTFIYVGKRLPSATQKHFETPWVGDKEYQTGLSSKFLEILESSKNNNFLSAVYKKVKDSPYNHLGPERTAVLVEDISQVSTDELKKVEVFG